MESRVRIVKVYGMVLSIFFLLVHPAMADTVVEGNSSSTVDVQTDTGGSSGNTSTHVETNVNGHVQNFDSTQPGNYHIYNNGTSSSVTNSSTGEVLSGTPSPAASTSSIPTPTFKPIQPTKTTQSIWSKIVNFFKSFFHMQ